MTSSNEDGAKEPTARSISCGPTRPLPDDAVPLRAFESRVSEHPSRAAVRFGALELSYGALDGMANAIAWTLLDLGLDDAPVAVCLPRSIELVAALYGIQKAGHAYLPLDLEGPSARLAGIVTDARATCILTSRELAPLVEGTPARVVLTEDVDWTRSSPVVDVTIDDRSAAYAIYTSGSTGRPKGVAVSHRSLWNRLDWMQRAYPLSPDDRVAQKTPYTFDVSVWEFFWPLMFGATLVVVPPEVHKDPELLFAEIDAHRISVIHFVPSMLSAFLEFHVEGRGVSLRTVFASGEAIGYPLIDRFDSRFPGVRLVNLYGPTEAAIDVTHWDCADARTSPTPPIGRAIQNIECLVLDDERTPAAIGEEGELYLSGVGLAIGYLGDPERTSESFLPNPYARGRADYERIYRTGDRARLLPDGTIEYLGRRDDQIKLRGFRIELQEIDRALEADSRVTTGCSVVQGDKLVAFVELQNAGHSDVEASLQEALRERLPSYMIPYRIVPLPRLPSTGAGKVDKGALRRTPLPAPGDRGVARPTRAIREPRVEAVLSRLRAVWADVLKLRVEDVQDDRSFFEHGGDSLSMLQAIARCKKYGVQVSLAAFDAHPYLPALAEHVALSGIVVPAFETPAVISRRSTSTRVTPFQAGMLRYAASVPESDRYLLERSVAFSGSVDVGRLEAACRALVARHDMLRSRFVISPETGEYRRIVDDDVPARWRVIELEESVHDSSPTVLRACREHVAGGFCFEREPAIRFMLVKLDGGARLSLATHHLIVDGTSFETLFDELVTFYAGAEPGESQSPSFATYERWIAAQDATQSARYWRERLDGYSSTRFERTTHRGTSSFAERSRTIRLSKELVEALHARNVSVSTALNFAFGALLSRHHGRTRLVWGNVVDLRPEDLPDAASIVGPCIATIPIAADYSSDDGVLAFMRGLQRQILESRPHAHLDPADIAGVVGEGTLFDAAFTFQRRRAKVAPALEGVEVSLTTDAAILSSHFAVTLSLVQDADRVEACLAYRQDALSDARAADLLVELEHLVSGLERVVDQPTAALDALAGLPGHTSLLVGPEAPGLDDSVAHVLRHAADTPARVAVVDADGREYTYAEVAVASAGIAAWLAARSVRGAVGVAVPRSFLAVAAVIGILRAGGYVVALDEGLPRERMAWICAEVGVEAIVGCEATTSLSSLAAHFIVAGSELTDVAFERLSPVDGEAHFAASYTSGSTGVPKLVLTSRRSHENRLAWLRREFPASSDDVFCWRTRLAFAPALREILEPLSQGARLAIVSDEATGAMDRFVDLLTARKVTRIFLTPTFLHVLLESGYGGSVTGLRLVEISGEPVPRDLVERVAEALPDARLLNRYGATEAASVVYQDLSARREHEGGASFCAVGAPIQGAAVAVVDEHGRLLPRGSIGEIWLGGQSVASGYSDRARTDESFVSRSFGALPSLAWFKTGDRGLVDGGGSLHYHARGTRMIKRAGFRIEPREIEVVLEAHPGVGRCVVVGTDGPTGQRLVALVERSQDTAVDGDALRAYAQQHLPAYMLPNEYVTLAKLPATDTGKVDLRALVELAAARSREHEPPRTPMEASLLASFRKVLRSDAIGVLDGFFDVGDSLLALRMIHEIKVTFGLRFDAATLYRNPSVRMLAAHIGQLARAREVGIERWTVSRLREGGHRVFVFPPAGGDAHSYRGWESYLRERIALYAAAPLTRLSPRPSLDEIAARYAMWIRELDDGAPFSLAGWSLGGTIAYAVACRLAETGCRPYRLVLVDPGFNTGDYDRRIDVESLTALVRPHLDAAGVPEEERGELVTNLLADSRLIRDYRPSTYEGGVVLVKPSEISEAERNFEKPWNGLEQFARGHLRVRTSRGDHTSMMTTFSEDVCEILMEELCISKGRRRTDVSRAPRVEEGASA